MHTVRHQRETASAISMKRVSAIAEMRTLALGLAVTGTVGILVRARRRGLVGPLTPLLTALRASGQRLSEALVHQALADVGEAAE